MSDAITTQSLYFSKPGPSNTEAVLRAAKKRADELGLKKIVFPTCSGRTAYEALKVFDPAEYDLIAVSHVTGFNKPNEQELPEEVRAELKEKGIRIITAAHAMGSIGRAVRNKTNTFQVDEIIAWTLRLFGHGTKVCIELTAMAADRGFVRTDEDVIAIGGTGKGVDTALVIKPANTHLLYELKVREVIAKPWRP